MYHVVTPEEARGQAVLQVVAAIGDLIGDVGDLRLDRRLWRGAGKVLDPGTAVAAVRHHALAYLGREIEPTKIRVLLLQLVHHTKSLQIMLEAAMGDHLRGQRLFAGMAEGRMPKVVGARDGLGQIDVGAQRPGDGHGDLRRLLGVREPRAVVLALEGDKDLRLIAQTAVGRAVDDAVTVALKGR